MRFDVLTLFPEMIEQSCSHSIMKRAIEAGIFEVNAINPRNFAQNKHRKVDDTPFGGGCGMVLMPQPFVDCYDSVQKLENSATIMLTPQGETFSDKLSNEFSKFDQLILICGHYEGFDERIREIIKPREISIGDFILTGGELPALCLIDSISRKLEGTLGDFNSISQESFSNGMLEYPQYTKPRNFRGYEVPEVLLGGNHALIEKFRREESQKRTRLRRPDLFR